MASRGNLIREDRRILPGRLGSSSRTREGACYFLELLIAPTVPFWDAAAAIVFGFSFFGFFASRLPRCSPLAIACLPLHQIAGTARC
jgi:hypothetical protein